MTTILLLAAVIAAIIVITAFWKIHPLPALLLGAFVFAVGNRNSVPAAVNLIATGFGNTLKSIGIVIIIGTILGAFMERRGALDVIARRILRLTGKKHTAFAMSVIGYIVSICIFCDSAFVILIGVCRKISSLAKAPLAVGATALSLGLFASHCFIPPTPGPLAALSILNADFGRVLLYGSIAAFAAAVAGGFYAAAAGKNEVLAGENGETAAPAEENAPLFSRHWSIAFLPIVLPLALIGANSLAALRSDVLPPAVPRFLAAVGIPAVALALGAALAIFCLGTWRREELTIDGVLGKAVVDAANILVITGAGGAFGEVLKHVDFTPLLPAKIASAGAFALLIPLGFAAVLKIAQGSSTLAILTAAGVMVPLLEPLHLTSPAMRALCCCAVCCGGLIVSHTNDSFFWVVTKFSGMSVRQGLKLQTIGSLVSGGAAAAALLVLACFR